MGTHRAWAYPPQEQPGKELREALGPSFQRDPCGCSGGGLREAMGKMKNGIPCFLPRTSSRCAFSSFTGKHGDTFSLWGLHPIPPLQFHPVGKITQKIGRWGVSFSYPCNLLPQGSSPHLSPPMSSVSANRGKGATTPKEVQVPSGRKSELLKKQISYQVKIDRLRKKKLSKSRRKEKWGWRGGRILCSDETIKNGPIRAM